MRRYTFPIEVPVDKKPKQSIPYISRKLSTYSEENLKRICFRYVKFNIEFKKIILKTAEQDLQSTFNYPNNLVEIKEEFDKQKLFAQNWINNLKEDFRTEYARLFTFCTVKSYWNLIYDDFTFSMPKVDISFEELQLDDEIIKLAKSLAKYPSKLDFVEASFQIGNIYTSLLSETYRSSHGIFYTSPEIAYRIIQMAED